MQMQMHRAPALQAAMVHSITTQAPAAASAKPATGAAALWRGGGEAEGEGRKERGQAQKLRPAGFRTSVAHLTSLTKLVKWSDFRPI